MNEKPMSEALNTAIESSPGKVNIEPVARKPPADSILKWLGVQILIGVYVTVIIGIIIFLIKASG